MKRVIKEQESSTYCSAIEILTERSLRSVVLENLMDGCCPTKSERTLELLADSGNVQYVVVETCRIYVK